MADKPKYCIDSSSLLELRALDADVFAGIWDVLSKLALDGTLHAPSEVLRELTKMDDTVAQWAKSRKSMFFDPDQALIEKVIEVQGKFKFFDPDSDTPKADPFLVAHGALKGCTVISQERPGKPGQTIAKIPDACGHFGVRVITLSEFFREQGWTFVGKKK